MIKIDEKLCIGCGSCVKDCFPQVLELVDGKAVSKGRSCMECGHCVAVCPVNAVTMTDYPMEEVLSFAHMSRDIEPAAYLNHLKSRRSIRQFTSKPVSEEAVKLILEAGRYSPTGGNLQNVSYFISRNDVANFKAKVIQTLKELGEEAERSGNSVSWYSKLWLKMEQEFREQGTDRLFFDAGTVIVVSSNSPQSALIAAAHMETMIYSLGLGMLYSGFTTRAISGSKELQDYVGLKEGYQVHAVLVVGHPAVKYRRTVPRKPVDAVWY